MGRRRPRLARRLRQPHPARATGRPRLHAAGTARAGLRHLARGRARTAGRLARRMARYLCVLFTDLANPTSNAIYARIGLSGPWPTWASGVRPVRGRSRRTATACSIGRGGGAAAPPEGPAVAPVGQQFGGGGRRRGGGTHNFGSASPQGATLRQLSTVSFTVCVPLAPYLSVSAGWRARRSRRPSRHSPSCRARTCTRSASLSLPVSVIVQWVASTAGQHGAAGVPLRQAAVEPVEEAGDVDRRPVPSVVAGTVTLNVDASPCAAAAVAVTSPELPERLKDVSTARRRRVRRALGDAVSV